MTSSYKTQIVVPKPQLAQLRGNIKDIPCLEIMRLAMEKVARERDGVITDHYGDCSGSQHDCLLALRTERLPRGLGVDVDAQGQVEFKFDKQSADTAAAQAICRDIARAYAVIAIMRVQRQHGYNVSIKREDGTAQGKTALISAVRV